MISLVAIVFTALTFGQAASPRMHKHTQAMIKEAIHERISTSQKVVCSAPYNQDSSYDMAEAFVGNFDFYAAGGRGSLSRGAGKLLESLGPVGRIPGALKETIHVTLPKDLQAFSGAGLRLRVKRKLKLPQRPSVVVYIPGVFADPARSGDNYIAHRVVRMLSKTADYVISFPNPWSKQWILNVAPFPGLLHIDAHIYARMLEEALKKLGIGHIPDIKLAIFGESHGSILGAVMATMVLPYRKANLRMVQMISPPKNVATSVVKINAMIRNLKYIKKRCDQSGYTQGGSEKNVAGRGIFPDSVPSLLPKAHPDCLALSTMQSVFGHGLREAHLAFQKREHMVNARLKRRGSKKRVHLTLPIFHNEYTFDSLLAFRHAGRDSFYQKGLGKLDLWWKKLNKLKIPRMLITTDNDFINYHQANNGTLKQQRQMDRRYWASLKGGEKIFLDFGSHLGQRSLRNYEKRIVSALKDAFAADSRQSAHDAIRPGIWSSENLSKKDLQKIKKEEKSCNFPFAKRHGASAKKTKLRVKRV